MEQKYHAAACLNDKLANNPLYHETQYERSFQGSGLGPLSPVPTLLELAGVPRCCLHPRGRS